MHTWFTNSHRRRYTVEGVSFSGGCGSESHRWWLLFVASCNLFPTDTVSLVQLCLICSPKTLLLCCVVVANCSALPSLLSALPAPSYATTVRCYATLLPSPSSESPSLPPSSLSSISLLSPSCPSPSFCSFFYLPRLLRSAERKEMSSRLTSVRRQSTWHISECFLCCLR